MKCYSKLLAPALRISGVLLLLTIELKSFGQVTLPGAEKMILLVENQKSHQQVVLALGSTVNYKTIQSTKFIRARIAEFTDSTISFRNKRKGNVTVLHKDLALVSIPRGAGRMVGGAILLVGGSVVASIPLIESSITIADKEASNTSPYFLVVSGVAAMVGGVALVTSKKIDLKKSWKLRTSQEQK